MEASDALARANELLSARQPAAALHIFTEVLTSTAPGHPCAFLNRSLCYLSLGFPELAAMDALRGLLGASVARLAGGRSSTQGKQILTVWSATQLYQARGEAWATRPTCYLEGGLVELLDEDLASLYITSRFCRPAAHGKIDSVFHDVRMKAWYRLAYALWKCGGGSSRAAIDVLEDASTDCSVVDKIVFQKLGNRVLTDINSALPMASGKIHLTTNEKKDENHRFGEEILAKLDIYQLLRKRITFIPARSYPWNCHGLESRPYLQIAELAKSFSAITANCTINGSFNDGEIESLYLVSKQDMCSGDIFYKESSTLYVWSAPDGYEDDALFCDGCSTKLSVPNSLALHLLSDSPPVSPSLPASTTEADTRTSSFCSFKTDFDGTGCPCVLTRSPENETEEVAADMVAGADLKAIPLDSAKAAVPALPLTPPSEGKQLYLPDSAFKGQESFPDIQVCPCCKHAVFCSAYCFEVAAEHYHAGLCGRSIEDCIGRYDACEASVAGVPHAQARRLQNLMLGKLLAKAEGKECCPLDFDELWILGGDVENRPQMGRRSFEVEDHRSNSITGDRSENEINGTRATDGHDSGQDLESQGIQSTSADELLPWSFRDNIFLPLQLLLELGGMNLALDIKRYDGWVLNTVISKIQKHMRVTRQPRCEKIFDENGCVTEKLAFHMTANGSDNHPEPSSDNDTWIGSLHPILTLIESARSDDQINVSIREFGGTVLCTAGAAIPSASSADADNKTNANAHRYRSSAPSPDPSSQPAEPPAVKAGEKLVRAAEPAPFAANTPEERDHRRRFMDLFPFDRTPVAASSSRSRMRSGSPPVRPAGPRPMFGRVRRAHSKRRRSGVGLPDWRSAYVQDDGVDDACCDASARWEGVQGECDDAEMSDGGMLRDGVNGDKECEGGGVKVDDLRVDAMELDGEKMEARVMAVLALQQARG